MSEYCNKKLNIKYESSTNIVGEQISREKFVEMIFRGSFLASFSAFSGSLYSSIDKKREKKWKMKIKAWDSERRSLNALAK